MCNSKILIIGGSRNIGYFTALRLLKVDATVTFLLRSPSVFDKDATIQEYVKRGIARLVKGDALVKADVQRAWDEAAVGEGSPGVDVCLFTVGGIPHFHLTKGAVLDPPNLVTQSLLNVLSTLPTPHPKLVVLSSNGVDMKSHGALPLPLKPLYSYLLDGPHRDKSGAEKAVGWCAGWENQNGSDNLEDMLGNGWTARAGLPARGSFTRVVVIRPALLTDGDCKADQQKESTKPPYRVNAGELKSAWNVSRKDVAHFVVDALKHWDEWEGKCVTIAY